MWPNRGTISPDETEVSTLEDSNHGVTWGQVSKGYFKTWLRTEVYCRRCGSAATFSASHSRSIPDRIPDCTYHHHWKKTTHTGSRTGTLCHLSILKLLWRQIFISKWIFVFSSILQSRVLQNYQPDKVNSETMPCSSHNKSITIASSDQ